MDDTQPGWTDAIRTAPQGRGVDVVLEMTGGAIARDSLKVLAPFGRVVVYGLDRAADAHRSMASRSATGQLVLVPIR